MDGKFIEAASRLLIASEQFLLTLKGADPQVLTAKKQQLMIAEGNLRMAIRAMKDLKN